MTRNRRWPNRVEPFSFSFLFFCLSRRIRQVYSVSTRIIETTRGNHLVRKKKQTTNEMTCTSFDYYRLTSSVPKWSWNKVLCKKKTKPTSFRGRPMENLIRVVSVTVLKALDSFFYFWLIEQVALIWISGGYSCVILGGS